MSDNANLPVSVRASAPLMRTDDFLASLGLEVAKPVTRTVLSQKNAENRPFAFRIDSEIYTAKRLDGDTSKREPPRMCDITNLETGELQLWMCNTVFEGEMKRYYEGASYVGKSFVVRGLMKERGADAGYRVYQIAEIRPKAMGGFEGEVVADALDPEHEVVNRAGEAPHTKPKKAK